MTAIGKRRRKSFLSEYGDYVIDAASNGDESHDKTGRGDGGRARESRV